MKRLISKFTDGLSSIGVELDLDQHSLCVTITDLKSEDHTSHLVDLRNDIADAFIESIIEVKSEMIDYRLHKAVLDFQESFICDGQVGSGYTRDGTIDRAKDLKDMLEAWIEEKDK